MYIKPVIICIITAILASNVFANGASDKESPIDTIISNHIKAHGGIENWEKVTALELYGQYTSFSVKHNFYTLKKADGTFYGEYNLGHHRVTEVFNGTEHWSLNPWYETDDPIPMNDAEKNVIRQKAMFFSPFFPAHNHLPEIRLTDKTVLDGHELIVLLVQFPEMPAETWYLDAATYLPYKYESQWTDFSRPAPSETYFDDYREIDGLVLPFFHEQTYGTRHTITQVDSIRVNPPFDPELFNKP